MAGGEADAFELMRPLLVDTTMDELAAIHARRVTFAEDTGGVVWVIEWAQRRDIPTPVVALAQQLLSLYRDAQEDLPLPMAPAVALMRHGFGGYPLHERHRTP